MPVFGEYSTSLFAEDAYQLMKAIGVDEAYFLGYSMGGSVALELALNHAELVKALVLTNSSVGLAPPSPEALERRRVPLELPDKGDMKKFAEMMTTRAFSPDFKSKNPTEFKKYMKVKLLPRRRRVETMRQKLRSEEEQLTLVGAEV